MKRAYFIIAVIIQLLICVGCYFLIQPKSEKHGFIVNQQVFDGYKGKLQLESKLNELRRKHIASLDSMESLIKGSLNNDLIADFEETKVEFASTEQKVSAKYTEDIWKEINQSVSAYGKQEGYDFIYGAIGNGSLMYGSEALNVTNDVVNYLNKRYDGEE